MNVRAVPESELEFYVLSETAETSLVDVVWSTSTDNQTLLPAFGTVWHEKTKDGFFTSPLFFPHANIAIKG
jgi:hypothetical protein